MSKSKKKAAKTNREAISPEVTREKKLMHLWAGAFLFIATFVAYSASLNGTWALDDSFIGQFQNISNVLNLRLGYRKIAYLSFQVNKLIDPFSPLNYRLFNILIHIVNAMLVYRLAFLTLRLPGFRDKYGRYAYAVSLVSAVVFALHPININAVTYIVQRMASLATLFVLLALLSYISARTSGSMVRSTGFYAATALFVFLGIFSKENGIMAIPLLMLYDLFFLQKDRKKSLVQTGIGITAVLLALGVSYFVLGLKKQFISIGSTLIGFNRPIAASGWTAIDVYWTPLQHILTEFRVIARYIFLMFAPLPRFLVFDWWGFPISAGMLNPVTTLTSFLMIIAIISFSIYKRKKLPFLSFGVLWYFVALSLESFIAVGSDLYFEHRNYLPSAGLIFGVASQLLTMTALRERVLNGKTLWTGTVILSICLGFLTFQRNLDWKDSITLWTDTVHKTQRNLRAMKALGNAYLKMSDVKSAKQYYREVMEISMTERRANFFQESAYSLGMMSLFTNDLEVAKRVISLMDARIEDSEKTTILKGFYLFVSGDIEGALKTYTIILPSTSGLDRVIVHTLLGDAFSKKGVPDRAIENYEEAVRLDPSFAAAYYGLGTTYLGMKDLDRAEKYIVKTLALEPLNPLALADMADIQLIRKEPPEKAERFAARAIAQSPSQYQPYLTMGTVMTVMGKEEAAEGFYRKAREHGAKDYLIPFSKARAYYLKGDGEKVKYYMKEVLSIEDTPESLKRSLVGNP
ncbi:MAG: tetratricopeptide repeat protein [Thermodesulfovibrionales bacterium]